MLSSHGAAVTNDLLKLGYTSFIFVDVGVKVNGTYYCDLLVLQQLMPAVCHVSSEFVFWKLVSQQIWHTVLSDTSISQGSVSMPLRFGGICNHRFTGNFLVCVTVKEVRSWKIGEHLPNLWTRVLCLIFLDSRCICTLQL